MMIWINISSSSDVPARNSRIARLSLSVRLFLNTTAAPNGSAAFSPRSSGRATAEKHGTNSLDVCCLATGGKRLFVSIDDAAAVYKYILKKKKRTTRSFNGRAVSAHFGLLVASTAKLPEPSVLSRRLVPRTLPSREEHLPNFSRPPNLVASWSPTEAPSSPLEFDTVKRVNSPSFDAQATRKFLFFQFQ